MSSSAKAPPVYLHYLGLAPAVQASARISVPFETPRSYYCALRWEGGHIGLRLGGQACDRQAVFCMWDTPAGPALSEEHSFKIGSERAGSSPGAVVHYAAFSWETGCFYEFVVETEQCAGRTFISASAAEVLASGASCPALALGTISLPGQHSLAELGSHLQDVTPASDCPGGRIPLRRMKVGHITAWSDDHGCVCHEAAWSSVGGASSDGPVRACGETDWFRLESGTGIRPIHRPDEVITVEPPRVRGSAARPRARSAS